MRKYLLIVILATFLWIACFPVGRADTRLPSSIPSSLPSTQAGMETAVGGRPMRPYEISHMGVALAKDRLWWAIEMPSIYSVYDSIWITGVLTNTAHHRILFDLKEWPLIELRSKDAPPRRVSLGEGPAVRWSILDKAPLPGDHIHRFKADIKKVFGPLKAGDYELQLIWPANGYVIGNLPGFQQMELKSGTQTLRIADTTVAASATMSPAYNMIHRKSKPTGNPTELATGVVTNDSKTQSYYIPYFQDQKVDSGKPLRVPVFIWRWTGEWVAMRKEVLNEGLVTTNADPNLPKLKVLPGQSVEILLPDWMAAGDGLYLYRLEVYYEDTDGKLHFLGLAHSEPWIYTETGMDSASTRPSK